MLVVPLPPVVTLMVEASAVAILTVLLAALASRSPCRPVTLEKSQPYSVSF